MDQYIKVQVYSLVSGAKSHSADLAIVGALNYSNTQAFTVLPGTHLLLGLENARVSKVPCLGAQISEHIRI